MFGVVGGLGFLVGFGILNRVQGFVRDNGVASGEASVQGKRCFGYEEDLCIRR